MSKIKVLLVQPNKEPIIVDINNRLDAMQAIVGGYIEVYMPFDDDVAIICDEEGKVKGKNLNRAIYSNGEVVDVIAGDFFLCYSPAESEDFLSLPDDLIEKYKRKFKINK